MMQTMRENTKWIMLAVAIAFVALMVFQWGMDLTGRSGAQFAGGELGRVNGDPVSYEEYNAVYRNLYDQQQQYTSGPIGSAFNRQIEDAAWNQIVMQHLVTQELRRRGIVVTDDEIRQAALYQPPPEFQTSPLFQTDGQFDLTKYHQYMSSPTIDTNFLLQLETYYREEIPRTKLFLQQTAGTFVTDEELWQMWRDARDSVTVKYLVFDPQVFVPAEGVSVSDAEIAAYYQEHRTDFLRPARATVRYVFIDRRPIASDTAATLERVEQVRNQILGGADFGEVAQAESADSITAVEGGKLTIQRNQTVAEFDEAAFSQAIGEVGEPVLSPFGYHIIRVDSRSGDEAELRHILIPIELAIEREDRMLDLADSLDILAETLTLDQIGRDLGLEIEQTDLFPGLAFLPVVGEIADGADWAFHEALPGEVSQVFDTQTAYYALELVDREEERTMTLEEATQTVRSELANREKIERTMGIAREAVDRLRAGQSLEEVALDYGLEVQEAGPFTRNDYVPGIGSMNAAIGTAFGLRPGQTSGAVESERSIYIIRTESREDADRAAWEQQKAEQRLQVIQALAQQRWEEYLVGLRENANVVDNREMLARQAAAQSATY